MITKKIATAMMAVTLTLSAHVVSAQNPAPLPGMTDTQTVAHGGGCRKDSPPGQCCHAGSQPYHCH